MVDSRQIKSEPPMPMVEEQCLQGANGLPEEGIGGGPSLQAGGQQFADVNGLPEEGIGGGPQRCRLEGSNLLAPMPAQSSFQTPCLVGIWSRNLSRTCVELLFEIQGQIDPNDL